MKRETIAWRMRAPAAAMGMMIFYTNAGARILHAIVSRFILGRTQVWRTR